MSWAHQFWADFKKNLDFVFFPSVLLITWFPFDKGKESQAYHVKIHRYHGTHESVIQGPIPGKESQKFHIKIHRSVIQGPIPGKESQTFHVNLHRSHGTHESMIQGHIPGKEP